jgi:hypothetical protein
VNRLGLALAALALCGLARAEVPQTAAALAAELQQLSIDPAQTYRVRDLQLFRGDLKIYLTEGVLSFAAPLAGRRVAVVFTTAHSEGGDGEVLTFPSQRSERASLLRFSKTPNLDEHLNSAVFFFSDNTAQELRRQIEEKPIHLAADLAPELAQEANSILRENSSAIEVRLVGSLLDHHPSERGFFYGMIGGRDQGAFDVGYDPDKFEPISIGRVAAATIPGAEPRFQVWASFRPRGAAPFVNNADRLKNYRVETTIHPDLSMSSLARFDYMADDSGGPVVMLNLATRLRITSAAIDGKSAEVFERKSIGTVETKGAGAFLLIAASSLQSSTAHQIEVHYEGSVIRQTGTGGYFVDERNQWYPFISPMLTTFDLIFHCPENLRLVATGEPVSEEVKAGVRTVHRKTPVAEPLAGFNLGDYTITSETHGPYLIDVYANRTTGAEPALSIPADAASVLDYYSRRWMPLPIRSLAISPIEGYFGQGFPGLIYLSNIAYMREEDRPPALRDPRGNSFFSELLLPHELAHQWWGNMVSQADYRAAWLLEAMANYSALQYLERSKGSAELDAALASFRDDLSREQDGKPVESAGPVDFGERLLDNSGLNVWHAVVYEKGAWILHMLHRRLGDEGFQKLQMRMLERYATKPISNEDFRELAAGFVPATQPDRTLNLFFETWIYGTGLPRMALRKASRGVVLNLSGVDDDFTLDVPMDCQEAGGKPYVRWVRAITGDNIIDLPRHNACELPADTDFLRLPADGATVNQFPQVLVPSK